VIPSARLKHKSDRERFDEKVDRSGECHNWTGSLAKNGYGYFRINGKTCYAHRVAYEMQSGPTDLHVMHRCDNRRCVNPAHLSAGTRADNMADMTAKRRQAHGPRNGHAKLSVEQVQQIRTACGTHAGIAKSYGVSQATVSMIKSGATWRYV
jgi:hypothetical protein